MQADLEELRVTVRGNDPNWARVGSAPRCRKRSGFGGPWVGFGWGSTDLLKKRFLDSENTLLDGWFAALHFPCVLDRQTIFALLFAATKRGLVDVLETQTTHVCFRVRFLRVKTPRFYRAFWQLLAWAACRLRDPVGFAS